MIHTYLEDHEFVVWLWSPGIDLNTIFNGHDKELDAFIAN